MVQQWKRLPLPLVGVLLLALLIGVYLTVNKRFKNTGRVIPIRKHKVETQAEETLKYWNAARKNAARPAEMPHVDGRETPHPRPE